MSSLTFQRIDSLPELESLETEWRQLEPQLPELPFVTYDWIYSWWVHFREEKVAVKDELRMLAARSEAGSLVGVVPLMATHRPGVGPLRVRQLQFIGADPNITEVRTIAAPASQFVNVYDSALAYLRDCSADWDWVLVSGVPASDASSLQSVSRFKSSEWTRDISNLYLEMKPTWAEFKTNLSRNIKESLRKCYNAPKRDGVVYEFVVKRTVEEAGPAADDFLRLHKARADTPEGVPHPNVFATQAAQRFLKDICQRFAARDSLRVFQTLVNGQVIATRIGFVLGQSLYLYYSGYDPKYAQYSVMTTTVAEAIQYAIANGFQKVNLSTGLDVSKLRWGPVEVVYRDVQIISPSTRGVLTYKAYTEARKTLKQSAAGARLRRLLLRRAP